MTETCNSLWIGPSLGAVERACLRSVLRQGHRMSLYCYRIPEGVPKGVELCDAGSIISEDRIVRHHTGSVALFSNWFRYELQRLEKGIWIDADQYLIAPIRDTPHLFGWQEPGVVAAGVLRLPASSPMLPELLAIFEEKEIPFWLPLDDRLAAALRRERSGRTGIAEMPWGSAGPAALSALVAKYGLGGDAVGPEVYYPVHYSRAAWILDPELRLEAMIAPATVGVHLWNEHIKLYKDDPAPPGSFLARLQREGASSPDCSAKASRVLLRARRHLRRRGRGARHTIGG